MKTLKFALIAVLIASTMVSLANSDGFKSKPKFNKKVILTIEKALDSPGLVVAIFNQVTLDDVLHYGLPPYIFEVQYNGALYIIGGTRQQWLSFFRIRGVSPPIRKEAKVIID
jgi:hypothetical protein